MSRDSFIIESNMIEGITRAPTQAEIDAHERFWSRSEITVAQLRNFVRVVAEAVIRNHPGQDVRVGAHVPPPGGPEVTAALQDLLTDIHQGYLTPYGAHRRYETLHPFMDGNGRSGRALWAWHMLRDGHDPFDLSFLHRWYYQSLDAGREQ